MPEQDVESACTEYFRIVLSLVFECYEMFGPEIDAHQRYTSEYFARIGKTIEDAEEELGFPRGWTDIGNRELIEYRWQTLRYSTPGCEINHLFDEYLGKTTPPPPELPDLELSEKQGWQEFPGGGKIWLPPEWRKTGDVEKDYQAYIEALGELKVKFPGGTVGLVLDSPNPEV